MLDYIEIEKIFHHLTARGHPASTLRPLFQDSTTLIYQESKRKTRTRLTSGKEQHIFFIINFTQMKSRTKPCVTATSKDTTLLPPPKKTPLGRHYTSRRAPPAHASINKLLHTHCCPTSVAYSPHRAFIKLPDKKSTVHRLFATIYRVVSGHEKNCTFTYLYFATVFFPRGVHAPSISLSNRPLGSPSVPIIRWWCYNTKS